nr:hypothetical protein BDOA9_0123940 [Bradyrhizobium sp. DOA9]
MGPASNTPSPPARRGPGRLITRQVQRHGKRGCINGGARIATMPPAMAAPRALVEAAAPARKGSGFSAYIKGLGGALDPEKAPFLLA